MTNVYKYAGAVAVVILVVAGIYTTQQGGDVKRAYAPEINKVGAGAFGSLSAQDDKGETFEGEQGSAVGVGAPTLIPEAAVRGGGGGIAVKSMIMPSPYSDYKYVYAGEEFTLDQDTVTVLRRVKGAAAGQAIANQVTNLNLGILNLSSFEQTKMQNVSFLEDKEFGYRVDINFTDNSISIYENWEKWDNPSSRCADDSKCYEDSRLKISDVPSDSELISIANNFLSQYGINTDAYGEPEAVDDWRNNYDQAEDKAQTWIPDQIQVRYPLIVEGEIVHDQSGNPAGLSVNINIRHKRAAGVWGLRANQFESSDYEAVKSVEDIKKVLEAGGMGYVFEPSNVAKIVELGTPEQILMQTYNWSDGQSNELLVPALKFPVINQPEGEKYFWRQNIIIPLAKELFEQQLPQPRPMLDDDVIIMERADSDSDDEEGTPPPEGADAVKVNQ
ncbi:hypothetical protein KKF64_03145 [Patescibacteria group bacterium]|nr:hypothetical protein [Patescibacteria group bacterium]